MRTHLQVELINRRSAITRNRAENPVRLVTPKNHGHAAWAYQSSYGGGFVGEDDISLDVDVLPGATLYLSSQASAKVYRATNAKSAVRAHVGENATLISWPDPVVCFSGASLAQTQTFALAKGATLLAVDAWTAGRVESGERWSFERLTTRMEITREGERIFTDATRLSPKEGELAKRMGPLNAFATTVLVSNQPLPAASCQPPTSPGLLSTNALPWGLVARLAAPTAEALHRALRNLLQAHVAALLGDDPLARKW